MAGCSTVHTVLIAKQTVLAAAAAGHLDVLHCLTKQAPIPIIDDREVFFKAAGYGHLHIVQWLFEIGNASDFLNLNRNYRTVWAGHFHIIKWLLGQFECQHRKDTWILGVMRSTVDCDNLDMLKYLYEQLSAKGLHGVLTNDEASCKLEIMQWLRDRGADFIPETVLKRAAVSRNLEVAQWMYEYYGDINVSTEAMDSAAASGDLSFLKWLHDNRSHRCSANAMNRTAARGHLDIVKWLYENRSEGNPSTAIRKAAAHGFLNAVNCLHELCSQEDLIRAMRAASTRGHVEIFQWLHENGVNDCEGINAAYQSAIENGQVKVVAYLALQCGARCPRFNVADAIRSNRFHLPEWLLQYGPDPVPIEDQRGWQTFRRVLSPTYYPTEDSIDLE